MLWAAGPVALQPFAIVRLSSAPTFSVYTRVALITRNYCLLKTIIMPQDESNWGTEYLEIMSPAL